jgi:hypothetical protein
MLITLLLCDGDSDCIDVLRAATNAIIPVLPETYTFPSVGRHPLGMSGNALSLARAGRNPDGNRRCPWDLGPACASLGYFSHGANSEVELATRHSIATTPKYPSSHACPFRQLHIRLLEGENPSNSVSPFVWSPDTYCKKTLFRWRRWQSQLNRHISFWSDAVWEGCLSPPGKSVSADRYPFPLISRSVNAK